MKKALSNMILYWKFSLLYLIITILPEIIKLSKNIFSNNSNLHNILELIYIVVSIPANLTIIIIFRYIYDCYRYDSFSFNNWWEYLKKYFIPNFAIGFIIIIPIFVVYIGLFFILNLKENYTNFIFDWIDIPIKYFYYFSMLFFIIYKCGYFESVKASLKAIITYQKIIGIFWITFIILFTILNLTMNKYAGNYSKAEFFAYYSVLISLENIFSLLLLFLISSDLIGNLEKRRQIS